MEEGTAGSPSVVKGQRGKKMGANEIDQYIGSKIRLRRTMLGISQQKLGELLSLTFQQVQKYERGFSRVGGSRLFQVSQVLEVPISYFFDGMPQKVQRVMPIRRPNYRLSEPSDGDEKQEESDDSAFSDDKRLTKRETLELARNYYNLPPNLRRTFLSLCRTLAKETQLAEAGGAAAVKKKTTAVGKVAKKLPKG